jgi:hypothetical protein
LLAYLIIKQYTTNPSTMKVSNYKSSPGYSKDAFQKACNYLQKINILYNINDW